MNRMTWTDGSVDEVTLNEGVRDEIEYLLSPPSCQRIGASTSALPAEEWVFVPFEVTGAHSYDSTGGDFGNSAIKLYAPEDGLYQIDLSLLVTSTVGASAPEFSYSGVCVNAIEPLDCTNYPELKIACQPRGTTISSAGVGTVTIPMSTGQWICVGVYATEGPFTTKSTITKLSMRRVGDLL